MTIEGIERAKKNGAYCIGITDSMLSPLARFSDELLIVPINSLSFAASYVAPLALIDLITAGVGNLRAQAACRPAARGRPGTDTRLSVVPKRVLATDEVRICVQLQWLR
jgi:DNA-binding MurR/RpiR family transcriptional regulator